MTTSFAFFVRGRVDRAVMANSGGMFLALIAAMTAPWALFASLRGRYLWGRPSDVAIAGGVGVFLSVTLVDWAVRLILAI